MMDDLTFGLVVVDGVGGGGIGGGGGGRGGIQPGSCGLEG